MKIEFNPTITDAFVDIIIKQPVVKKIYDNICLEFGEQIAFDFVKDVMITSFTMYSFNVNDAIVHWKKKAKARSQ